MARLWGQGRGLAGGERREGREAGGDRGRVVRQYYDVFDRLRQTGVAFPRTSLVAWGYRGADWRLFEHRAHQGRAVLLALTAPYLGQRVGMVFARQSFRSDARRLQAQSGPLPLMAPSLNSVGVPGLYLYGARPEKITDLRLRFK